MADAPGSPQMIPDLKETYSKKIVKTTKDRFKKLKDVLKGY